MFNKLRLLTPGPTPLPENVRLELSRDMIHHRKKDFQNLMFAVQKKLQILFGTENEVLPLASSGTGAMNAAALSLFSPGEKVLVGVAGKFGERWMEIAVAAGLEPIVLNIEWGRPINPDQILAMLEKHPDIRGVFIQLCETSTGVLMPIRDIAEITSQKDILLVVDGISGVGISPCPMDAWKIDALLTGSQKGLMLPPGLSLIALSRRAWEKAGKMELRDFYFNLSAERLSLKKGQTHFTTPINLIYGLNASMDILLRDGLGKVYKHQWALTMLVRQGAKSMGLKMLAPENFAWGLTSIKMPENSSGSDILAIMQDKYGVCMAGGQDRLKNKIIRFGHMGWVDWGDCMAGLNALAEALREISNFKILANWQEKAMQAWNYAMSSEIDSI